MISAQEALERLRDGNRRFVAGEPRRIVNQDRRGELVAGQSPFAVILGCSDSRVPPEIIFDQGLGDLFVVRVAGNIAGLSQIGSIEYAVEHLGSRLVVVLGHSGCGAVQAALDELTCPSETLSPDLQSILDPIQPSVASLREEENDQAPDALMSHAVRANILASADQLRHGSEILSGLAQSDGLHVVGAEYSLETGVVDFFDVPEAR